MLYSEHGTEVQRRGERIYVQGRPFKTSARDDCIIEHLNELLETNSIFTIRGDEIYDIRSLE